MHSKPNVRGLVIATLYRQGRIDMHPAIPMVTKGKNKNAEYEDIYPRSRSGLGGLYFSNGSPSSIFRKDLSQSTAMMIINPQTRTADIKTSIKLPDNAFPSTTNVPGGMIVFKYCIEIIVDLCGKLAEPRLLPRLTSTEPSFSDGADNTNPMNSDWANHILDTVQLRRTKSVVDFTFSIIVGTKDSTRVARRAADESYQRQIHEYSPDPNGSFEGRELFDETGEYYPEWDGYEGQDEYAGDYPQEHDHMPPPTHLIPPPPPEEPVDEKERLRREEALLLPGQPPEEDQSPAAARATAPSAPQESDLYDHAGPSTPQVALSGASTRSFDTIVPLTGSPQPPAFEGESSHRTEDDKQDLERQRLLAEASAPPTEEGESASQQPTAAEFTPSAPVLNEEEEYNAHTLNHDYVSGEHLPQYWR